jgi:ABC-2 type transport system permease protein
MNPFAIIAAKEIRHILRDKKSLLILMGIPAVLVLLFGFAITTDIDDAGIGIIDKSKDAATREIQHKMVASGYFEIVADFQEIEQMEEAFRRGQIHMGVIFGPEFHTRLFRDRSASIQFIADASDPNTATTLVNYAQAIVVEFERSQMKMGSLKGVQPEIRMLYNNRLESVFMFVPGVMTVILMLVSAMMTSIALTREKEKGNMELLLVSPIKPSLIILGKVVPYILLSFINTLVILLLGYLVFQMPVRGSIVLLLAECVLFVIAALALGIFVSTKVKSQLIAMMISLMALMLPTILLSGFIFPIENMPDVLQWLSHIIPAKWFIIIIKNIMLKGSGFMFVWKETVFLILMTFIFIIMSMKNFKIRLE